MLEKPFTMRALIETIDLMRRTDGNPDTSQQGESCQRRRWGIQGSGPGMLAGVFPEDIPMRHRGALRLTKPYDMHEIRHAIGILASTSDLTCWAQTRAAAVIDGSTSRDAHPAGHLGSPKSADAGA